VCVCVCVRNGEVWLNEEAGQFGVLDHGRTEEQEVAADSYDAFVAKILREKTDAHISPKAMRYVVHTLLQFGKTISFLASSFSGEMCDIRDIQQAIISFHHGSLADSEVVVTFCVKARAIVEYNGYTERTQPYSAQAGLVWPVGKLNRHMLEWGYRSNAAEGSTVGSAIYLSAVLLQHIASELLASAATVCRFGLITTASPECFNLN